MKTIINISDLLKHLSFWHNKTDDECIILASNKYGVDAKEALLNMLERDFCTSINNSLNMNKGKEKAEVYAKSQYKDMFEMLEELNILQAKNDYLAGYNEGYNDGFNDGKNDADNCIYHYWISIENEPEYLGKYLVKFDNGDIDVCWLSDKHGKLNWYTHSECDIEFKTEGVKYYRTIDSL